MMWNKHYGSMYQGSMIGAGALVFAVMGYVIANQVPDAVVGAQVELNPKLLSFILGESEADVAAAIKFLCAEDPKSRTPELKGKRLVQLGEYAYQVVNGEKYAKMRNEDDRRRQNREAQRRYRAKKGLPLPGETASIKLADTHGPEAAVEHQERIDAELGERAKNGPGWISEVKDPPTFVKPW